MNPNNVNATGTETNEPNEWDSLAEAADTGKEGEMPGDENDGWSVIDHPTDDSGTGIEKAGEETGTEKEGEETGDETAYTPPHAVDNTGMENMTGTEMEGYSDGTGEETTGHEIVDGPVEIKWASPEEIWPGRLKQDDTSGETGVENK